VQEIVSSCSQKVKQRELRGKGQVRTYENDPYIQMSDIPLINAPFFIRISNSCVIYFLLIKPTLKYKDLIKRATGDKNYRFF